jgi:hypothetical protein
MPQRILELGISAIQAGSTAEGARLLRFALKRGALSPQLRAVAHLWLAETTRDPERRRQLYREAISLDPANTTAQALLARALDQPSVPAASSAPPPEAAHTPPAPAGVRGINLAEYVANIIGSAAGALGGGAVAGTGLFVASDGLIATARSVVGASERVTVELHGGQRGAIQLVGLVVRSFPDLDLAFIRVDHRSAGSVPITDRPRVDEDEPLTLVHYTGETLHGRQRPTRRVLGAEWIATSFNHLHDAGGGPVFDGRGLLCGLITRNTGRTSRYFYALHIHAVYRALEAYRAEASLRHAYCPCCGSLSRLGGAGYSYCETCGAVLPHARATDRRELRDAPVLYDEGGSTCAACGSAAGRYQGMCLRCGQPASPVR